MIMKKVMTIIITVALAAILLAACGSKKEESATQTTYDNGAAALSIMEKCNNGELDPDTAEAELEKILDALSEEHDELTSSIKDNMDNRIICNELTSSEIELYILAIHGNGDPETDASNFSVILESFRQ